jgi:ankyrin repeat protein
MKKFFVVTLVLNFMAVKVCASGQVVSAVEDMQQNQNDFTRMKHALLMKNMPLVYQIQEENPEIWSYVDPQTGRMLIHEIFIHAYPVESIEHVIHAAANEFMNAKDALDNQPLHYFIQNATVYSDQELREIFKWLDRKDARPLSKNKNGVTPLHLAAGQDNFQILNKVMCLLPNGFKEKGYLDVTDSDGSTPLMYAIDQEKKHNIFKLLQSGALFDEKSVQRLQQLLNEKIKEHIKRENISDPEKQDELKRKYLNEYHQFIALCTAQAQKLNLDVNIVWMNMIRSGIGINVKDDLGNTVLHYAMTNYMKNNDGFTATPRSQNEDMVNNLLALGADPELKNKCGNEPDCYDNYSTLIDYYQPLQNSLKMNEERKTLFGESVMQAYEDWFSAHDKKLLTEFLCSRDNQIPELTRMKARSFFKPEFVKQICS